MDSDIQERFETVETRLTAAEEKIVQQDTTLSAIRKLILSGMKLLAETDSRLKALTDAQIATEDKLRRLLESQTNGH
ncbi:MAG: hypothetical protein HY236_17145 [Acidobacteria bacterium]|nr:hypothetical protein [Acidobacteriota bacterium]